VDHEYFCARHRSWAENGCRIAGRDATGAVVFRRRAKRETLIGLAAKLSACIVALEACGGAHHLGRIFAAHGHEVRLMSPEYVRPYVKAHKNDDRDAEATAEAAARPTMRFVALKSQEQLDRQTLHRAREHLVGERTALINQLRGSVVPKGRRRLEQYLAALPEAEDGKSLSPRMRLLIEDIRAQWFDLEERIAAFDAEFVAFAKEDEDARRLSTIPGIGALNATALTAAIGKGKAFESRPRRLPVAA
jgi:transposase